MIKKRLGFVSTCLTLIGTFFHFGVIAHACTCITLTPQEAKKEATTVFHGMVTHVEHLSMIEAPDPFIGKIREWIPKTDDIIVASIQVDMSWKGPTAPVMKVVSVIRPTNCDGYAIENATSYLIYANELPVDDTKIRERFANETIYDVGLCPYPNRKVDLRSAIAILGKGKQINGD